MLPRDKLKHILDPDSDFLELSLLAGLGMEYGDVPAAGSIAGQLPYLTLTSSDIYKGIVLVLRTDYWGFRKKKKKRRKKKS